MLKRGITSDLRSISDSGVIPYTEIFTDVDRELTYSYFAESSINVSAANVAPGQINGVSGGTFSSNARCSSSAPGATNGPFARGPDGSSGGANFSFFIPSGRYLLSGSASGNFSYVNSNPTGPVVDGSSQVRMTADSGVTTIVDLSNSVSNGVGGFSQDFSIEIGAGYVNIATGSGGSCYVNQTSQASASLTFTLTPIN